MATRVKRGPRTSTGAPAAVAPTEAAVDLEAGAGFPAPAGSPAATAALVGEDALAAVMESQAAMARGFAEASAEFAGLAKTGIDAAARTASDMLAVKTFADAIELSAGFAYRSFDTLVAGSARLSEIGLRAAAEASQPLLAQFGRDRAAVR